MSTSFYFNGKQRTLPGVYSQIKSGELAIPRALEYGSVLIIDTGTIAGANKWGGGAGVMGENESGQKAVYAFTSLTDFQAFVKGGMWWKWAQGLFNPDPTNSAAVGISTLYYVRAAATTSASMTYKPGPAADQFVFDTVDEGVCANGVLIDETDASSKLLNGYGYKIIASPTNPTAMFHMQIFLGSYKGLSLFDSLPVDEVSEEECKPELVWESGDFNTIEGLISLASEDPTFASMFIIDTASTVTGATVIAAGISNYTKAVGGTTDYTDAALTRTLSELADFSYNSVITDIYGAATTTFASKIATIRTSIAQESRYNRFLWIAGYDQASNFDSSISLAQDYDNPYVQVIHGDVGLVSDSAPMGYRWWGSQYNMCAVLGRTSGKPPYVPVTNKTIGVDVLKFIPSDEKKNKALQGGVILTIQSLSQGKPVVLQGINTLQDNTQLFNNEGQSFSIQFMRVVDQINRELVVNAQLDLLDVEEGVNVNTLSAGVLSNWTKNYLQSRVATPSTDNLLLSFRNITVTRQGDAYFVSYGIVVNNEINKLFFTGYLLRS